MALASCSDRGGSSTEAWSSRVALAGRTAAETDETDETARSHVAALNAYRALEAALLGLDGLPQDEQRERVASPLFAAMMCAYTVLDTPIRAAAHADGLREGERLIADAYAALRSMPAGDTVDGLCEQLADAHGLLRQGRDVLAKLSLGIPSISLEFFLADTFVSDYSDG